MEFIYGECYKFTHLQSPWMFVCTSEDQHMFVCVDTYDVEPGSFVERYWQLEGRCDKAGRMLEFVKIPSTGQLWQDPHTNDVYRLVEFQDADNVTCYSCMNEYGTRKGPLAVCSTAEDAVKGFVPYG